MGPLLADCAGVVFAGLKQIVGTIMFCIQQQQQVVIQPGGTLWCFTSTLPADVRFQHTGVPFPGQHVWSIAFHLA